MAHPDRDDNVKEIRKELKNVKVVWSKATEPSLEDVWETRKECLRHHLKAGKDFALTVQDDAILCKDFKKKAEEFVSKIGETAVYNLFFSETAFSKEEFVDAFYLGYARKHRLKNEIALIIPTPAIPKLLELESENKMIDYLAKNYRLYYSMPSLVDHKKGESLWKNYREPIHAKAWWFADDPKPEVSTRLESRRSKKDFWFRNKKEPITPII